MNSPPPLPKMLLSAQQADESLSICEKTLWSNSEPRGTIPVVKIGRRTLYDPRDLQAWVETRKRGAE